MSKSGYFNVPNEKMAKWIELKDSKVETKMMTKVKFWELLIEEAVNARELKDEKYNL
ncbi:MAG: hypothetical protein GY928_22215 [Colwellia sp.]|nr:hypothetical protein [Colwellia sp.]